MLAERVEALVKADEVAGDQLRALVDQLVEGVLAVGPRLAPVDRPGLVVDPGAVEGDVLAVRLHRQLLQVGREALQVLVVGQHRDRLRRRRSRCTRPPAGRAAPAGSARSAPRGSARRWRESRPASRRSAPGRSRSWSRARSPSPSSSARRPTPRSRTCCRCRCPNLVTSSALVETATKCFAIAASSPSPASDPGPRGAGVGHRLQRGEGLRGDDEQRLRRVEVAGRLGEVGAVDVGDEAEGHLALASSGAAPRRPSPGPGPSRRCRC